MRRLAVVVGFLALSGAWGASSEALATARSTVKEWVAVEKAISREAAEWEGRVVLLRDLIAVEEQRIGRLERELAKGEERLSVADQERTELLDREAAIGEEAARIEDFLGALEGRLWALRGQLPQPLKDELAPLFQRIPADPKALGLELGERMRTVVELLVKIRQFDGRLTLVESLEKRPGSEEEVSVRTLYLGLAQAYYLAPEDAGYGWPGTEGWVWESEPRLREAVREAISLAEGQAREPQFVTLPVTLEGRAR